MDRPQPLNRPKADNSTLRPPAKIEIAESASEAEPLARGNSSSANHWLGSTSRQARRRAKLFVLTSGWKKGGISAALPVELPGIENDALPGILGFELPGRSISVQLSTAR